MWIDSKAHVLRETGVVPELEDIQVYSELDKGQVLVRVFNAGLCATQLEEIFVSSRNKKYMPHLLGHEGVGEVIKVGPGVKSKSVGDVCVIHWKVSSVGLDSAPGLYRKGDEQINAGKVVAFSEFVVLPERNLTLKPALLDIQEAVLLGCSYSTGWGAVAKNYSGDSSEQVALIAGMGSVGMASYETARSLGFREVHTLDSKLASDPRWEEITSSSHSSSFEEFRDRNISPHLVVDTTGSTFLIEALYDQLSPRSQLVLVGMPKGGESITINHQKLLDGCVIRGSNGGDINPDADFLYIASDFALQPKTGFLREIFIEEGRDLFEAVMAHRSGTYRKVIF